MNHSKQYPITLAWLLSILIHGWIGAGFFSINNHPIYRPSYPLHLHIMGFTPSSQIITQPYKQHPNANNTSIPPLPAPPTILHSQKNKIHSLHCCQHTSPTSVPQKKSPAKNTTVAQHTPVISATHNNKTENISGIPLPHTFSPTPLHTLPVYQSHPWQPLPRPTQFFTAPPPLPPSTYSLALWAQQQKQHQITEALQSHLIDAWTQWLNSPPGQVFIKNDLPQNILCLPHDGIWHCVRNNMPTDVFTPAQVLQTALTTYQNQQIEKNNAIRLDHQPSGTWIAQNWQIIAPAPISTQSVTTPDH